MVQRQPRAVLHHARTVSPRRRQGTEYQWGCSSMVPSLCTAARPPARRLEARPIRERLAPVCLVTVEAQGRRLARRAVHPHVGDVARPRHQMASSAGKLVKSWPAMAFAST